MKMLHILFDDVRDLNGMDIIVRTGPAMLYFISKIDTTGHYLYLDNDLGGHIEGIDVLERLILLKQYPAHVYLVTSNTSARERMQTALTNYGYTPDATYLQWSYRV